MSRPVPYARTIVTDDGVPIDAAHLPGEKDLAIVLAHGFTQSWQRPAVWKVATRLNKFGGVVTFDFRGHGRSGGVATMGDKEIKDVDVAVGYARELGYRHVATIGFSMGASTVLRHAGLIGHVDLVVSVSGPGRWYYRGTRPMRLVHLAIEHRAGRIFTKAILKTRITNSKWDPVPLPPDDAAALIAPIPLLIVHGDKDEFFPVDHAERIYAAANEPKELWIVPGFGHAERGSGPQLIGQIGRWMRTTVGLDPEPGQGESTASSGKAAAAGALGAPGTAGVGAPDPVPAGPNKAG
jgi:pimeloyl-ACP methyl ester carboxylesterase